MEDSIYSIGHYELNSYAFAYDILPRLKAEKEAVIESLYDSCTASTVQVSETGMLVSISVNVENKAIEIIETKELYEAKIKRYEGKAKLFEQAMDTLTDRELDVIRVYYLDHVNDLRLSDGYFHQVLREAEQKLCGAIEFLQKDKFQLIKLREKEEKLQKIAEYKKAN